MFSSESVSVVIQGPLYRNQDGSALVCSAIESLRKLLPDAEIIVSTWDNESIADVDADIILQSEYPEPLVDINGNAIHVGAQIKSTLNGIRSATRPYVLKFRADLSLDNLSMMEAHSRAEVNRSVSVFDSPIIVTNLFTRNPARFPVLFHLSDIVQFGRRADMLDLWSSPEPMTSDIFLHGKSNKLGVLGNYLGYTGLRVVSEQYLMLSWLNRKGVSADLKNPSHMNYELLRLWERILLNDFTVIDWQDSGVKFPDRFFTFSYAERSCYRQKELQKIAEIIDTESYVIRYVHVLFHKYLLCWFDRRYWISVCAVILYRYSPWLAKRIKGIYRKISGAGKI